MGRRRGCGHHDRRPPAWGVDSPVVGASFITAIGAFLFSMLILAVEQETLFKNLDLKGAIPRKIVLLPKFVCPFILLVYVGALVVEWYAVGPLQGKWIGHALADAGVLGAAALCCLFMIPTIALEVWKTKAMGCCIAVSEKMTRLKA
ncbi:hypothetical protein EJB05_49052 [Eragrostis curvula]|uniref:Uncharacterized protein n=1 Tax=Eragrostis curvula TaxID=38414 RepID=A0A5J9T4H2_9POAL|nr:hypothetical protein EJB05_49052 [Eragrostis curvula]